MTAASHYIKQLRRAAKADPTLSDAVEWVDALADCLALCDRCGLPLASCGCDTCEKCTRPCEVSPCEACRED